MNTDNETKPGITTDVMYNKHNYLSNARLPGETFMAYKARREAVNKYIKTYLKGVIVDANL